MSKISLKKTKLLNYSIGKNYSDHERADGSRFAEQGSSTPLSLQFSLIRPFVSRRFHSLDRVRTRLHVYIGKYILHASTYYKESNRRKHTCSVYQKISKQKIVHWDCARFHGFRSRKASSLREDISKVEGTTG